MYDLLIVDDAAADGADQRQAPPVVTLLQVEDVRQQFGALKVLNGVGLAVYPGQALGVVGPDRGREAALMNMVQGSAHLAGAGCASPAAMPLHLAPGRRARLGLGRTYQVPRPLRLDDRVREHARRGRVATGLRRHATHTAAYAALAAPAWRPRPTCARTELTLLERKRLLKLARALATRPYSVLLLDEIASGLAEPEELRRADRHHPAVHEAGATMVWSSTSCAR